MLTIRNEQMAVFRAYATQNFADQMVVHLRKCFPHDCEMLGEAQVRRVIDLGIKRARANEFHSTREVCRYISLMIILGSYFDEDPQLPWVAQILQQPAPPSVRMDQLYREVSSYLERISGSHGEYYRRALIRSRGLSLDIFTQSTDGDLESSLLRWLMALHKEKFRELHETTLEKLLMLGQKSAVKYGLSTREGIFVYTGLMFMLGSHFDRDPLQSWAATALQDSSTTDPSARARNIYASAMVKLDEFLKLGRAGRE